MLRVSGFREPFYLQWHITDCCNLSCSHCYREDAKEDLGKAELLEILRRYQAFLLARRLKGRIQFAGGEPFLSPHLRYLLKEAGHAHLPVRILSNGTVMSAEMAAEIRSLKCGIVQVSVEGDRRTHDSIRGEGTFDRTLAGAGMLKDKAIEVSVLMTVSKRNHLELKSAFEAAKKVAKRFSFSRLVPTGSGRSLSGELLDQRETRELFSGFAALNRKLGNAMPMRDPLWQAFFGREHPHLISGCSAGYNGICVESDGTVYPCRRLPIAIGNILEESFEALWENDLMRSLRNRDLLKGRCGKCRLRWQCGGCRAVAYSVTGDPLGEDIQCFLQ